MPGAAFLTFSTSRAYDCLQDAVGADAEHHAADIRFVQDLRRHHFEHDRIADPACGGEASSQRLHHFERRHAHVVLLAHGIGFRLEQADATLLGRAGDQPVAGPSVRRDPVHGRCRRRICPHRPIAARLAATRATVSG